MGYSLTIGELDIEYSQEEEFCNIIARSFKNSDAPAFGETTNFTSELWCPYIAWANFCKFTGLTELFFNKDDGIIACHSNCVPLTQRHKKVIDTAYLNFKRKYPNAKAGYSPKVDYDEGVYDDPDWPEENNWLCSLEWLKYWVDWALANCKRPVFQNI